MAQPNKLKKSELQAVLDEYDKDMKALVSIKPTQFDTLTIASMTRAIPERKWNAAQAVVNGTKLKKEADNRLKVIKATKQLEASHNKDKNGLTAAEDRKAFVDNHEDVKAAEIDCINADAQLMAAKLAYECLDDLFTAGKKIMDWLTDADRATRQYDRFNNEARRAK